MPIANLRRALTSCGRISCGLKKPGKPKENGDPTTYPARSRTLVIHSSNPDALEVWRHHRGGEILPSPDDADKYFLQTEDLSPLPILLPSSEMEMVRQQWMEAHTASGILRKCDGITCLLWRDEPTKKTKAGKEEIVPGVLHAEDRPCICDTDGLEGDKRCKPVIRLAVLPADFWMDIPDLGVWTVTSGGWGSNTQLSNDIELLESIVGSLGAGIRLNLTVKQVASAHGDVPALGLRLAGTPREAAALIGSNQPLLGATAPVTVLELGADEAVGTYVDADPDEAEDGEVVEELPTEAPNSPAVLLLREQILAALPLHDIDPKAVGGLLLRKCGTSKLEEVEDVEQLISVLAVIGKTPRRPIKA